MEKGEKQYVDQELLNLIGANLKRVRTERNLSQRQLAWDCNTDESSIRRIEKGELNISVSSIKRISDVLNLPITFFFESVS